MCRFASGIDLWFHVLALEWSGYQIINLANQWLRVCSKTSSPSLGMFGDIWTRVTHSCLKLKYVKVIWKTDTLAVLRPADDRNPAESFHALKLLPW